MSDANPLLEPWRTPFGLPPFDTIKDEHFMPAFRDAMRQHNEAIDMIARADAAPTFANSVEAMERAGRALNRVNGVFWNLTSADTNDIRQDIERQIAPLQSEHWTAIYTNKTLFARIDALFADAKDLGLTGEQQELLEGYHKSFVRSGARLDEAGVTRIKAIGARLAELYTAFGQNILADEKAFQLVLETEADLKGLPLFVREAAQQAALHRGMADKHVITLSRSSIEPFLQFSDRRDLREKVYNAYIVRGQMNPATDTRNMISEILTLRQERAGILGFENYAQFRIADTMAKTPARARNLLEQVWPAARAKVEEERQALEQLAQGRGHNEPLAAWDWHYFTEIRRRSQFDIDSAELKLYFQLDKMIDAAFDTAHRLFGVTFHERPGLPVYHPDVRVWETKNRGDETIGLFIGDYFARANKRGGAWMSSFRKQQRLDDAITPIIVNVLNFSKAPPGEPTLLSLDDATTLFHEFGHGLHGLLSNVTYPGLSGTSVDRDFVELPSQIFENWLLQPETLARYAHHAKTNEPIPTALVEKVIAARKFNQGFATAEYTASALFDLDAHEIDASNTLDVNAFEAALRDRLGMPDAVALRHRPAHFQHIFTNERYAAGYYTYLWAEVMEADAFKAFEESGDIFDARTAERLYRYVYSAGASMRPEAAYIAFRGREPSIGPLIEKRGLVENAAYAEYVVG